MDPGDIGSDYTIQTVYLAKSKSIFFTREMRVRKRERERERKGKRAERKEARAREGEGKRTIGASNHEAVGAGSNGGREGGGADFYTFHAGRLYY